MNCHKRNFKGNRQFLLVLFVIASQCRIINHVYQSCWYSPSVLENDSKFEMSGVLIVSERCHTGAEETILGLLLSRLSARVTSNLFWSGNGWISFPPDSLALDLHKHLPKSVPAFSDEWKRMFYFNKSALPILTRQSKPKRSEINTLDSRGITWKQW